MRYTVAALGLLLPMLAGDPAAASEPKPDVDVYVYTNADLEQFDPIPTQVAPIHDEDLGWGFVQQVLEQGYARLDANRNYDLDRARVEAEANDRSRRQGYGLALAPYGYYRGWHKDKAKPHGDYANRPVPLHARRSLTPTRTGHRAGAGVSHGRPTTGRPSRGRSRSNAR